MKEATKTIIVPNQVRVWHLVTNPFPLKVDPFRVKNVEARRKMFKLIKGGK